MHEKYHHIVSIIDFKSTGFNTVFVKVNGYDAESGQKFEGEVKFLDGMPFGDLIHPQRSSLSPTCRHKVRSYLLNKYQDGEFN
ncbi:hypothetical protein [Niallia endozanthoxylica]|uniref:Uncharacterized protein n=1 Tax=Niallia endozanthoxylica TaxID=2036016 RepID=A0A5J5HQD5_9BACI|nr:hypothetical protein [Niallia endozanthoxylica]KAA9021719.1 hypothetical protein F4V44_17215 [Niallia endozanthoxylica]